MSIFSFVCRKAVVILNFFSHGVVKIKEESYLVFKNHCVKIFIVNILIFFVSVIMSEV